MGIQGGMELATAVEMAMLKGMEMGPDVGAEAKVKMTTEREVELHRGASFTIKGVSVLQRHAQSQRCMSRLRAPCGARLFSQEIHFFTNHSTEPSHNMPARGGPRHISCSQVTSSLPSYYPVGIVVAVLRAVVSTRNCGSATNGQTADAAQIPDYKPQHWFVVRTPWGTGTSCGSSRNYGPPPHCLLIVS